MRADESEAARIHAVTDGPAIDWVRVDGGQDRTIRSDDLNGDDFVKRDCLVTFALEAARANVDHDEREAQD